MRPAPALPIQADRLLPGQTAEAASSTLEDAYDDFAVAQVAKACKDADYRFFIDRSLTIATLQSGDRFMQEKRRWFLADADAGWTEGDKWLTYSPLHEFQLMALMGARRVQRDPGRAFQDGHNHHDKSPATLRISVRL